MIEDINEFLDRMEATTTTALDSDGCWCTCTCVTAQLGWNSPAIGTYYL